MSLTCIAPTSRVRLGLIGLGRWGTNYLNTVDRMPGVQIVNAAGKAHQIAQVKVLGKSNFTENWREVCEDKSLDGLIVATPPDTHFEITMLALELGIPVLVEKPFTLSLQETRKIRAQAKNKKTLCMVNYIHLYSKGYRDLKENVKLGGKIRQIYSESYADGPSRPSVPVLKDWGCHDVAMCIDLLGKMPESVAKSTILQRKQDDNLELITLRMKFDNDIEAKCTFGNASQFRRRDFCIVCESGVFVYDGLSAGLAKQYSSTVFSEAESRFKIQKSPLECAILEFVACINRGDSAHYSLELAFCVNTTLSITNPYEKIN
jgi:predicted dehydrogenase